MGLPRVAFPAPANWPEAQAWEQLNLSVGGNPAFDPLTVKAAYVIGTMHVVGRNVALILRHYGREPVSYMIAYGVFAASVELLGRCLNGNRTTGQTTTDLITGLKCLDSPGNYASIPNTHVTLATTIKTYTVDEMAQLRHFAAHGQATANITLSVDFDLLNSMPQRLGGALEWYWSALQDTNMGQLLCTNLTNANIKAFRGFPIWEAWREFSDQGTGRHRAIFEIFTAFDWRV